MIVFFKFHHKWAYGDNPEEHRCFHVSSRENLEMYQDELEHELSEEHIYSDKYRGVDVKVVENPPAEWVRERISRCQRAIQSNQEMIAELQKLLEKDKP